jgi:hypothetical protein
MSGPKLHSCVLSGTGGKMTSDLSTRRIVGQRRGHLVRSGLASPCHPSHPAFRLCPSHPSLPQPFVTLLHHLLLTSTFRSTLHAPSSPLSLFSSTYLRLRCVTAVFAQDPLTWPPFVWSDPLINDLNQPQLSLTPNTSPQTCHHVGILLLKPPATTSPPKPSSQFPVPQPSWPLPPSPAAASRSQPPSSISRSETRKRGGSCRAS